MKRSVQVELGGQTLSIVSDEPEDYVHRLAEYVDTHLQELGRSKRPQVTHRSALLVALKIADDLFRQRDYDQRFRARVTARLQALEQSMNEHNEVLQELS